MSGAVRFAKHGAVASVVFDRVEARNAMTWEMYDRLADACREISTDDEIRVAVFRGAGGQFVAGTDIAQFAEFTGAESGISYERRMDVTLEILERVPKPIIALIEGNCVGGGLIIAAACDLRIATPSARFGVPIARTLGNCLSPGNVARLIAHFGPARTKRMLLFSELIVAEEAVACGFVARTAEPQDIERLVDELCARVTGQAPLTMFAAKETIRRIAPQGIPDCDDIIRQIYGSADFREGVTAFIGKRAPLWRGI